MLLSRSLTVDGQFDHPLTCVALLEQGRIAMTRGDSPRAAQLLAEAGFSAYYYDDWDVLTESVWLGWVNHMATGGAGMYPPLEPIVAWAQTNRLQHIATKLRLAQAESLLWLGQVIAGAVLDEAVRRIGELRRGLAGIHLLYLQANLQLARANSGPAEKRWPRRSRHRRSVSLRNFQIGRTSEMYDAGPFRRVSRWIFSARCLPIRRRRIGVYRRSTRWPCCKPRTMRRSTAGSSRPLERKDTPLALEVAEKAKRRRFLAAVPLGGRLIALRTILEAPQTNFRARQCCSGSSFWQVSRLSAIVGGWRAMVDALRAGPVTGEATRRNQTAGRSVRCVGQKPGSGSNSSCNWRRGGCRRRSNFRRCARPPSCSNRSTRAKRWSCSTALAGDLYGFLVTRNGTHLWEFGDVRQLRSASADFLKALGNYGPNRPLSAKELRAIAGGNGGDAYAAVFAAAAIGPGKDEVAGDRAGRSALVFAVRIARRAAGAAPDAAQPPYWPIVLPLVTARRRRWRFGNRASCAARSTPGLSPTN